MKNKEPQTDEEWVAAQREDRRRRAAARRPKNIYFEHREYKGLIFNYVGPLYYVDGRKVPDFVSVLCLNDLGLRAYLKGAYTAVAKRSLTPYRGPLPNGETATRGRPAARRPPSLNERIEKTGIKVSSAKGAQQIDIFGDEK
jgi:hypothetical protein